MDKNLLSYEVGILGLFLNDEKSFSSIHGQITKDDFLDPRNSIIFDAITTLFSEGFEDVEVTPLINHLTEKGLLEKIGGIEYLAEIMKRPILKSNLNNSIKKVVDAASLRNVKNKITKLSKDLDKNNHKSAEDILEKVEIDILEATRGNKINEFVNSEDAINETIKKLEMKASGKAVSGISVGFESIDKITGGFQKGDLIILAARPSMGKTALALNMAAKAAMKNHVAFFSIEMPVEQLYKRLISFNAFVNQGKLRDAENITENEWNKIYAAKEKIKKMKLFVDETAGIKLSELVWKAKKLHKNEGLDIIFIDYLQLIDASSRRGENRQNEVSTISRTLKKLARDLKIPVVALAQLSRNVEKREGNVPVMSDLRESGAIEQDADIVSFLYRESYYDKDKSADKNVSEKTDIIFAKHRNGATGKVSLLFKPSNGVFVEEKA